jgi:hypothetical protein
MSEDTTLGENHNLFHTESEHWIAIVFKQMWRAKQSFERAETDGFPLDDDTTYDGRTARELQAIMNCQESNIMELLRHWGFEESRAFFLENDLKELEDWLEKCREQTVQVVKEMRDSFH